MQKQTQQAPPSHNGVVRCGVVRVHVHEQEGFVARGPNTQGDCDKRPCKSGSARTRLQSANFIVALCATMRRFAMRAV